MQAQFTSQTRRAIAYAQAEANRRGSLTVEPEHLLLAILRDDHGEARAELNRRSHAPGIIAEEIRSFLDAAPKPPERAAPHAPQTVVLSRAAQETMFRAARIAVQHGRYYTGTDHILFALLAEPTETLASVWKRHGVSADLPEANERIAPMPGAVPTEIFHERPEWNRYTFGARTAIAHALTEATQSGSTRLTPPFLLAGVLHESDTVAARTLQHLGVERNDLRAALTDLLETGTGSDDSENVRFTKTALAAIEEAKTVSQRLGDKHIGTEHLLLGLLAGQGDTADLLRTRNVATANFLAALRSVKRGGRAEREPEAFTVQKEFLAGLLAGG